MKNIIFYAVLLCAVCVGANPLGFTAYEQSFTVTFADEKAAAQAQLVPRGLPAKYAVALSSRWDDTDKRHLNTLKVMKKHGAKGNFYINGDMQRDLSLLKDILRDGCLAGVHTVNHFAMKHLAGNEHFYEYMANRIAIEVRSQTPVNTQTSPYGQIRGASDIGTKTIGRALMATGVIGSPDSNTPKHTDELGYPANSCFFMYRINSGDRVPDMKRFNTLLNSYLKNPDLAKNPAISMSTHSWHTPEGLKILDEMYRILTSNKDWWNCNQNEYAAYRYEALNTKIRKQVTGKTVKFTVLRFEPFELGAELPLYLDITGAVAQKADQAEVTDNGKQIKLNHKSGHTLPDKYGYLKLDGVELKLAVSENDGKVTAEVANASGKAVKDVTLTFRNAPKYKKITSRVQLKEIGKDAKVTEDLGGIYNDSRHYTEGRAYFAVQMDYTVDGKRHRLYADTFGKAKTFDRLSLSEAMTVYKRPKNWKEGEKLSLPTEDISSYKLEKAKIIRRPVCTEGAFYPGKTVSTGFIAVAEFESDKEQTVSGRIYISGKPGETVLYLNGKQLPGKRKSAVKINVLKGRNRLVVSSSPSGSVTFMPDVNYIKK